MSSAATKPDGFFFLVRNGPKVGGFPRTVETLYLHADGSAARTREDDDNVLYAVSEGRVDAIAALETLAAVWPEPVLPQPASHEPDIVSEYHEALVVLWLARPDGEVRHWSGATEDVPAECCKAIDRLEQQVSPPRALPAESPRVFLRAHRLGPESEAESRRAGLLREADADTLAHSRALREGLANPFRLIPLEPGENPFEVFGRELQPGRTVLELVHQNRAFQVRVPRTADGT